jgi:hypothetical protein
LAIKVAVLAGVIEPDARVFAEGSAVNPLNKKKVFAPAFLTKP